MIPAKHVGGSPPRSAEKQGFRQGGILMRTTTLALLASAALALVVSTGESRAQTALAGTVTSAEEGAMEGVLVTARRDGATFAITVVTDAQGRYGFPARKLEPGHYSLHIRAVGYDVDGKSTADVAAGATATADLRLKKARSVASQLTNAEWIESVPGTAVQKDALFNCVGCHTLERIVKSTHDADEFVQTMKRMSGYANQSLPIRPQKRKAERLLEERGAERDALFRKRAEWLASINLSEGQTWEYPLKTLPRPKGRETQEIITEYDLPRPTIEPHDVVIGSDGMAWYTNFGEQNVGRLDPKTGQVAEFALPELKKGWPQGSLGLRPDRDGNLWIGMMYQGAIGRVDPKTGQVTTFPLPPEMNKDMAQVNMVRAESSAVDGRVWSQNNGFAAVHRLDRDHRAVQERQGGREPQHLRRRARLAEQPLLHRLRATARRPHRRQDAGDHALRAPHQEVGAAPRHDGRAGSHVVRRIPRQPHRHVRHEVGEIHRVGAAAQVVGALRRDGRPKRRGVDRLDDERPRHPARSEDRHVRQLPAATRDQHPPRVRRQLDHPGDVLGRQQPRRLDRQAGAAELTRSVIALVARSPDGGAQRRNPGRSAPDYASLHPGYGLLSLI